VTKLLNRKCFFAIKASTPEFYKIFSKKCPAFIRKHLRQQALPLSEKAYYRTGIKDG